jgi:hypothetical protein
MKKFLSFIAAAALSVMVLGAQAQKPSPGKMGSKMSAAPGKPAAKGVTGTSKGTVKGTPTAASFVLTTDKGDKTVDTSSAKFRNASGQFVKGDALTSGAMVEATGTWKGKTLVASAVKITSLKAGKPAGGKMSGGKMGGAKMRGAKK